MALITADEYIRSNNKNDRGYPIVTDPRALLSMVLETAQYLLAEGNYSE